MKILPFWEELFNFQQDMRERNDTAESNADAELPVNVGFFV
jgi:hypothetical protein